MFSSACLSVLSSELHRQKICARLARIAKQIWFFFGAQHTFLKIGWFVAERKHPVLPIRTHKRPTTCGEPRGLSHWPKTHCPQETPCSSRPTYSDTFSMTPKGWRQLIFITKLPSSNINWETEFHRRGGGAKILWAKYNLMAYWIWFLDANMSENTIYENIGEYNNYSEVTFSLDYFFPEKNSTLEKNMDPQSLNHWLNAGKAGNKR